MASKHELKQHITKLQGAIWRFRIEVDAWEGEFAKAREEVLAWIDGLPSYYAEPEPDEEEDDSWYDEDLC